MVAPAKLALVSVIGFALCTMVYLHIDASASDPDESAFKDFMTRYGKSYATEDEYERRLSIFKANSATVERHNALNLPWQMAVNEFTDLTQEEFRLTHTTKYSRSSLRMEIDLPAINLPDSMNWVTQGAVTEVKNQGTCGSCWSFSATGSMEGAHFLATGDLESLSEQQILNCAFGLKYDTFGCFGGSMDAAFEYVIATGGLESESEYSYSPYLDFLCHSQSNLFVSSISTYQNVPSGIQLQLKAAVAQQPVSVAVEADQASWQFYKGGVISSDCGQDLDHGVLAVGYGTDNGVDYWLVKNSWGADWGEQGFIRILRNDTDTSGGLCGIALDASYPIV